MLPWQHWSMFQAKVFVSLQEINAVPLSKSEHGHWNWQVEVDRWGTVDKKHQHKGQKTTDNFAIEESQELSYANTSWHMPLFYCMVPTWLAKVLLIFYAFPQLNFRIWYLGFYYHLTQNFKQAKVMVELFADYWLFRIAIATYTLPNRRAGMEKNSSTEIHTIYLKYVTVKSSSNNS